MRKSSSMSLFAMAAMFGTYYDIPSERNRNRIRPNQINTNIPKVVPKGCKVFKIEGVEIIASNEKNAIRKFKNIKNESRNIKNID